MNHIVEEYYSKHGYPLWMKRNKYIINNLKADMNNQCIMLENNLQDKSNQNKAQTSFTIEQIPQLLRVLQNFKNKINQINATSDSSLPQNKIKKINS